MKKITLTSTIIITLLLGIYLSNTIFVRASTYTDTIHTNSTIEYLDDNSYFKTDTYMDLSDIATYSSSKTRTGSKTKTYYSSDDKKLWSITVTGTFTYNGSSSKCTSCSGTKSTYSDSWKVDITSKSKSGNTSLVKAVGKLYFKNHVVKSISQEVSLKCKPNGTLY